MFKHDWSGIPEKPPQGAGYVRVGVTMPRIAQTAKEVTPRVRVSPRAREKANVRISANTQGGNSVTIKTID